MYIHTHIYTHPHIHISIYDTYIKTHQRWSSSYHPYCACVWGPQRVVWSFWNAQPLLNTKKISFIYLFVRSTDICLDIFTCLVSHGCKTVLVVYNKYRLFCCLPSSWQIPRKVLHAQNAANSEPQIPRYKFNLNQNLNLKLYCEIPRNLSFSIWWILGL